MKKNLLLTALIVASAVALSSPERASACVYCGGIKLNGVSANGISLQGVKFNGIRLNGIKFNGLKLQGVRLNGIKLQGVKLNGTVLSSTSREQHSANRVNSLTARTDWSALQLSRISVRLPQSR
jgi:uncharacterized protein YjbI with pentapeptide repeats